MELLSTTLQNGLETSLIGLRGPPNGVPYTLATLPSAVLVGSGVLAYTTDQGPVYSNGSIWTVITGGTSSFPMGFNVLSFGAKNDGTNLSVTTAAIQAAYDAASIATHGSAFGGAIYFPPGEYRCGPIIQNNSNIETFGAGRGLCKINFVPTGDSNPAGLVSNQPDPGSWLTVAATAGTTETFFGGIRDIRIATDDLTFNKNALLLIENSQFNINRVVIDKFWGNNSCGLHLMGHELCSLLDYDFSATIPIRISPGFFPVGGVRYNDHHQFINGLLRAPHGSDPATYYPSGLPNTCILIDDATFISNLTIDRIAFVGGRNAVYWVAPTTAVSFMYKFSVSHGRKEQPGGTNAPAVPSIAFVLDFTSSPTRLQDFSLRDFYVTSPDSGIYARKLDNLLLENVQIPAPTASSAYVMDVADVYTIKWINVSSSQALQPAGLNIGVNVGSLRNATFRANCNLPNNGEWTFESNPRVAKTLAAGVNSNFVTVFGVSSDIGGLDFPTGVETIVFDTTAGPATLTGLPTLATGVPYTYGKRIRCMVKNGGSNLTLTHNDAAETTASHRWECPLGASTVKQPGQSWFIEQDNTLSRYVVI